MIKSICINKEDRNKNILIIVVIVFFTVGIFIGTFVLGNKTALNPDQKESLHSFCGKIQDQGKRSDCYFHIAKTMQDLLAVCDKMQDQENKDRCYSSVAISKRDLAICGNIESQDWKNQCQEGITQKQALYTCENTTSSDLGISRDVCYHMVAIDAQDFSICDKMEWNKDSCYGSVAVSKRDFYICDKIEDQNQRDSCYSGVAKAQNDPSICDKIMNENQKDSCYLEVITLLKN